MKAITSKGQFKTAIRRIAGRELSQREDIQNCYDWGVQQFVEHGNATPLGNLYRTCEDSKVSGFTKLKRFIQDHNNVAYVDGKDDAGNECKIFRVRTGEKATNVKADCMWFDYEGKAGKKAPPKVKVTSKITSAINAIQKGIDEDNMDGSIEDAQWAIKKLNEILSKVS